MLDNDTAKRLHPLLNKVLEVKNGLLVEGWTSHNKAGEVQSIKPKAVDSVSVLE
jgi:hypothetical protein